MQSAPPPSPPPPLASPPIPKNGEPGDARGDGGRGAPAALAARRPSARQSRFPSIYMSIYRRKPVLVFSFIEWKTKFLFRGQPASCSFSLNFLTPPPCIPPPPSQQRPLLASPPPGGKNSPSGAAFLHAVRAAPPPRCARGGLSPPPLPPPPPLPTVGSGGEWEGGGVGAALPGREKRCSHPPPHSSPSWKTFP
nr:hypothetical protein [Morchella crassipes]